eukprot:6724659-Alexandrium_andersonii.AAC.1
MDFERARADGVERRACSCDSGQPPEESSPHERASGCNAALAGPLVLWAACRFESAKAEGSRSACSCDSRQLREERR